MPFPLKDGEQIAINTLTREFSRQGCEVTVLAINTPKHFFDPMELPVKVRQQAQYHAVEVDTRVKPFKAIINLFSSESYNIQRFYDIKFAKKLTELLQIQQFDIIQCEGIYLASYLPIIRRYSRAKVILRAHNVEFKIWEQLANSAVGLKKNYFSLLAKRMKSFELAHINLFDGLVPISGADEIQFKELGSKIPTLAIPVGLEMKDYTVTNSNEEYPSLFHIGSMDWLPNVEAIDWFLNNCWPLIQAKHPKLKLCLAGRNFPKSQGWSNCSNVDVVGEVTDSKYFISSKSIMIVPLQHGSGMRVKIVEAMALGKAIVSTSVGAMGTGTTSGKDILIADSASDFADAVGNLVNNKSQYDSLCHNAKTFAQTNFDTIELTKKLLQFYRQL